MKYKMSRIYNIMYENYFKGRYDYCTKCLAFVKKAEIDDDLALTTVCLRNIMSKRITQRFVLKQAHSRVYAYTYAGFRSYFSAGSYTCVYGNRGV
jgi:hypothetical protein